MSDDLHFKDLKSRMERFKIAKRHLNIVFFILYIYIYIYSFANTDNSVFNNCHVFSLCIPVNHNQTAVGLF